MILRLRQEFPDVDFDIQPCLFIQSIQMLFLDSNSMMNRIAIQCFFPYIQQLNVVAAHANREGGKNMFSLLSSLFPSSPWKLQASLIRLLRVVYVFFLHAQVFSVYTGEPNITTCISFFSYTKRNKKQPQTLFF